MIEIGQVAETNGGRAKVVIPRKDKCGKCGKCLFASEGQGMWLEAENRVGAGLGDEVEVEIPERDPLVAALLLFGLPLLGLLVGVFSGYALAEILGWESNSIAILLGFVFLAAAFVFVRMYDRRRQKKEGRQIRIVRIIK